MFEFEKFYTEILSGGNVEFENYILLILSKFKLQPLEEVRREICSDIANLFTNPSLEFLLNVISNPR